MVAFLPPHFSVKEIVVNLIFLIGVLPFCFLGGALVFALRPQFGAWIFDPVERFAAKLAAHKRLAIALLAGGTILTRVSLLGLMPVPVPRIHDEFSYLLAADTFAHGRLTNPTHPMWIFFETFHVNQQPTYMSKYPPGQGAVLALGQVLGHPWIGVLISVAVMCPAVLWMLQGWLPARWALLGAALVVLRLGIFGYWMNSYWGGALAATGGALVVGALPRIIRFQGWRDVLFLAMGAAILANTRPLEGAIFCLPVMLFLLWWLCSKRSPSWGITIPRLVLPFSTLVLLCASFMAYYNWRGTGDPLRFPYMVNEQTYSSTPTLFWQKARAPLHYRNPQFDAYYNQWARNNWSNNRLDSAEHAVRHTAFVLLKVVYFFLWPELCLAFSAALCLLRDRRIRILIVQTALCFVGFLLVPWTEAHYAAPLAAVLFLFVVQGIRYLRTWRPFGRPVGIGFSRLIVLSAILFAPSHHHAGPFEPETQQRPKIDERARFLGQLKALPGNHLVIVRYAQQVSDEWVYNDADIDGSKVVWAREIPGEDSRPLLDYFHGRRLWLAEPDASPPRLSSYGEQRGASSSP